MASPPLPAGAKLLVELKAGKMIREGKMVKPDDRKGLLRVIRTEDGLTHLEWYQRSDTAALPEDDIVIFPQEATFAQVGKPEQRVMQLKFPEEAERNMLFWMQEPSADRDAELVARTNKVLNEAVGMDMDEWPTAQELMADAATYTPSDALTRGVVDDAPGAGTVAVQGDSMGVIAAGPGQQVVEGGERDMARQLAQMFSGMAGGTGGAGGGTSSSSGGRDPGAALMAALLSAVARQGGGGAAAAEAMAAAAVGPGLAEILRPEVMLPLLQDDEVLARLSPYLPEGQRSPAALSSLAHSPQFQQQLTTFSEALQTGQLDLRQFGLTAQGFSVADFLTAIQDLVDREQQGAAGAGGSAERQQQQ